MRDSYILLDPRQKKGENQYFAFLYSWISIFFTCRSKFADVFCIFASYCDTLRGSFQDERKDSFICWLFALAKESSLSLQIGKLSFSIIPFKSCINNKKHPVKEYKVYTKFIICEDNNYTQNSLRHEPVFAPKSAPSRTKI